MRTNTILLALFFLLNACSNSKETNEINILSFVSQLDNNEGFSGAVLIAKNDKIIFEKAYGYAHIGHKVKNNLETKFNMGSIGKSFTALAIIQLLQEGKLALNDPIGTYLLDYPNESIKNTVTVKHLLTHTSGLPHYFARKKFLEGSKDLFRTIEDLSELYENEPIESAPGIEFSYRNTNYVLLARIIEKITGIKYDDYLEEYIYKPALMVNTGNFDLDHPIDNAAEGYTTSEVYPNKFKVNIHTYPSRGNGAGGGYSTLHDLFNFTQALKERKLLNEQYTNLFTKPIDVKEHYGLGMQFPTPEEGTTYGHSGGHFGVGVEWRVYSKEGYTVIVLTNKDTDKGFLSARYYIQKVISGPTPSITKFFNTKNILTSYYKDGYGNALEKIKNIEGELNEFDFIMKGYDAIKKRDYKTAIDIFRLGIEAFPNSYDLYDSLGEAYMESKQSNLAISNYKKSLELNPENENAENMIKEIETSM